MRSHRLSSASQPRAISTANGAIPAFGGCSDEQMRKNCPDIGRGGVLPGRNSNGTDIHHGDLTMKKYKTVVVPERAERRVDCVICDLCGDEVDPEEGMGGENALEINVNMTTGINYPDGGLGNFIEWDICPKCFEDKLVPWFESQGAPGTATKWDW